jgi:nucleolar GTP-binding protein
MNFQTLPPPLTAERYIDIAFRNAKKNVPGKQRRDDLAKQALQKVGRVEHSLDSQLTAIIKTYPQFSELPPFYKELSRLTLDVYRLEQALSSIAWGVRKIKELSRMHERMLKRSTDQQKILGAYYGRINSVVKRLDKHFLVLHAARRIMKTWPDIKDVYTVCIVGFPNVGKSTLLSKLTPAKPQIQSYAFTTKSLQSGFITTPYGQIQIIDTPGTLNRPEKMNEIEQQAQLALTHLAKLIIYVFDPTDTYSFALQKKLYEKVKSEADVPVIVYVSKTDLAKMPSHVPTPWYTTSESLKEVILYRMLH